MFTGEWIGATCLLAAAMYKVGHVESSQQHGNKVIETLNQKLLELPTSECDVMYGRAGALQAIWFLRQALENPQIGRDSALLTNRLILMEGLKIGQKGGTNALLMWEWKGKKFLGAAHGVVGILQTLLGHTAEEWDELERDLPRHPSGNLRTIADGHEEDRQMCWAHGSPGYCFLLIRAAEVFNDQRYLDLAKDMAVNVLWQRRSERKSVGLSHGVSGIGYAFLALARADTGEQLKWLACAKHYAISAVRNLDNLLALSRRPYSLFKGLGGLVRLLIDLDSDSVAQFPLCEKTQCSRPNILNHASKTLPRLPCLNASPQSQESRDNHGRGASSPKLIDSGVQVCQGSLTTPSASHGVVTTISGSTRGNSDENENTIRDREHVGHKGKSQVGFLMDLPSVETSGFPFDGHQLHGLLRNPSRAGNPTLFAQQFVNACLSHSETSGDLSTGGLGVCGYLQMRVSQHLSRLPGDCRTRATKPLTFALSAATEALQHAELCQGSVHVSLLSSEWVGAKCLLAAVLHHLGKSGSMP